MNDNRYSVEEVTKRLGITARTLHYYEEIGLIPEVGRSEGRHRFYDEATVGRLEHILRLKHVVGVSLQEILDILGAENELEKIKALYRQEPEPPGSEKLALAREAAGLLNALVDRLDEKINGLTHMRDHYKQRLDNARRLQEEGVGHIKERDGMDEGSQQ